MIRRGARARLRSAPHVEGRVGYWHAPEDREPFLPNLELPYPYTLLVHYGPADEAWSRLYTVTEDELEVIDRMSVDGTHQCPAPRCAVTGLPTSILACPRHWRILPWHLKVAVTNAWRRGSMTTHAEARQACVDWWEAHT